jgi:hypothetical protein
MQWIDRARAMLHAAHGLSLPDPDRIDIGSVPDTGLLIQAIDAAMPRSAILQLIGPCHKMLVPFVATRSVATRRSTGEYFIPLDDGAVAELARLAACCAAHEVCSHLFVQDGEHTLLEAFGRDRHEDVVWLSRRLRRARIRRFLEVVSGAPPAGTATLSPLTYRETVATNTLSGASPRSVQGKAWEMHDVLFQNPTALAAPQLVDHARAVGLDTATFSECVSSGRHAARVEQGARAAAAAGVQGTPGFVIGKTTTGDVIEGTPVRDAQPFDTFRQIIDRALPASSRATP